MAISLQSRYRSQGLIRRGAANPGWPHPFVRPSSPLKKGTFFFSGHLFAVFLKPEKMDVPFFNGFSTGC
jgi:hypothetical protein